MAESKYTVSDYLKQMSGLNNALLAYLALEYCDSMYPLYGFRDIKKYIEVTYAKHFKKPNYYALGYKITTDLYKQSRFNNQDPKIDEIWKFCSPLLSLQNKFNKFQNLVYDGILDCQVSGNEYGAHIITFTMKTYAREEEDPLFMKVFNTEDFTESKENISDNQ